MNTQIRFSTVKLLNRITLPLAEAGTLTMPEQKEIITQLKYLAQNGEHKPIEPNKLLSMQDVAERLGLGLSTFKRLEKEGEITIPRRKLGNSVRYQLHHVLAFIDGFEEV